MEDPMPVRATALALFLLLLAPAFPSGSATASPTIVAVIDSGIDASHSQFSAGQVVAWTDLIHGRPDPYDDNGHGTAVASRVGGAQMGSAPGTRLAVAKVLDESNALLRTSDLIASLRWAQSVGASVITVSIGSNALVPPISPGDVEGVNRAIREAREAGIVVVWAAGNADVEGACWGNGSRHALPAPLAPWGASSPEAIVVGASWFVEATGATPPFPCSRVGPDVLAFGACPTVAAAGGGSTIACGTSFAAPFVAGEVALVRATRPDLPPAEVERIVKLTAIDRLEYPFLVEGYGRIGFDAIAQALAVARGEAPMPARPADELAEGSADLLRIAWTRIL